MPESSSPFSISLTGSHVAVVGEIDAHTAPEVSTALSGLSGSDDISLDLQDVTFIDSSGLRVIIEAHKRADAEQRRLLISNPSKAVRRLIEVTGLGDHLHLPTVD